VIFHDANDLRLIYHVETFQKGIEGDSVEAKRQREYLKKKAKEVKGYFDEIVRYGSNSNKLKSGHRTIVKLLREAGYELTSRKLRSLRDNLRYQRGVHDKFRESLIRSGKYLVYIEEIFKEHGLPVELAALPHVESSFDYNAYSHAGAAGIWQFTRGTGRSYLRISSYVDERLDPIRASQAAAQFLNDNYSVLGSWPITITSYNHGKNGMLRARKQYGTDLRLIVDRYKSRYFGFASRNFYAEFLAALEVSRNYEDYFGPLSIASPIQYDVVALERAYDSTYLTSVPGITRQVLQELNPHLRRNFTSSRSSILPAGISLRVPVGQGQPVTVVLASAKPSSAKLMIAADGSTRYRVQPGDALGEIASVFGTSIRTLQRLNGIRNANRIYPGQVLLVSGGSGTASAATRVMPPGDSESKTDTPEAYQVRRGDNLSLIAKRFSTTVNNLMRANSITDAALIYPGKTLVIPKGTVSEPRKYIVRKGDTLERIASLFDTSINKIKHVNGISNPNRIQRGQRLLIP
jgi:membrane-bound lytic murein transglycosylase D